MAAPRAVALVENDETRSEIWEALQADRIECLLTNVREDAERLVGESQPAVVLLEASHPAVDDIVAAVRSFDPHVMVLLIADTRELSLATRALQSGADGYILRPVSSGALDREFRRAVMRRETLVRRSHEEQARRDAIRNLGKRLVHAGTPDDAHRSRIDVLANIAQELRSPLTPILGWAHFLNGESSGEEVREAGDVIMRRGCELLSLVESLIAVAAGGANEHVERQFPIRPLFERAVEEAARRNVLCFSRIDEGTEWIAANPDRVAEIMEALIDNAITFGEGAPIFISSHRRDRDILIAVVDHGSGVDPEDRERIFQPQTSSGGASNHIRGSAGLSLCIGRTLARLEGGDVWYEETPGGGATFAMRFPAGSPPDAA